MKLFYKVFLIGIFISLFQIVIIPSTLKIILFKNNPSNVKKIRNKATEICKFNTLWGEKIEEESILALICEIDKK
tara:strand:- start:1034 stop:1258 length:225 start_codon:yes stop_codon:yes gene_type:complete